MFAVMKKYWLPLVSGVGLALCFPTWHLYFLGWVALIPLLYACRKSTPSAGAWRFFLAGWAFYSILLQWLLTNYYWAGGWAFWGHQAVSCIMAGYWALTGGLWIWMRRRLPWFPGAILLMVLWMAMEYVQGRLLTGFGWGSLGYSQGKDIAFLQLAAIGGTALLAGILVAVNALLAEALYAPRLRLARLAMAFALVTGVHGVGLALLGVPEYGPSPLHVGIFQSNFPQEMKWDPEYTVEMVQKAAENSRILAEHEPVDLFVWPETLIMEEITYPAIFDRVTELTQTTGTALFAGAHRIDAETGRARNSSFLISPQGTIEGHYDKIRLAPFGEYVPLGEYFTFIQNALPIISNLEPGRDARVLSLDARTFGPLICFEVLFPDMSEALRRKGADFLVVITNLGWFGASNALEQELEQARLRAVETRLPLVHSANTGISGVFDPWGRLTGLNAVVTRHGTFHRLREDVKPQHTKLMRCLGSLPVPQPGERPVPWAPERVPQVAVITTAVLVLLAATAKARKDHQPE